MSDIYLSITETPTVVTLSQPVVSGVLSSNVTVTNVVSVNVVTMPAITVQAAAPAVTTVAGTVTANVPVLADTVFGVTGADVNAIRTVIYSSSGNGFNNDDGRPVDIDNPLPISGTVTVGNSVTIGSLPAISGTVTAMLVGRDLSGPGSDRRVVVNSSGNTIVDIHAGDGSGPISNSSGLLVRGTVTVGNSVTIGSVPNGSLTTRFGTPTTANTAFATSAVTNANRKYLLIQNVTTGSNVITVGVGFTPTTTQGIQLTAGAGITFESSYIPTGAVYVLSSVTASNFTILEA